MFFLINLDLIKFLNSIAVGEFFLGISTLLNLSEKQISDGSIEINSNYREKIIFKDKLICLSLSNN